MLGKADRRSLAASATSSKANSWVMFLLFTRLARMWNRTMFETMSSGGFSRADVYCHDW